MRNLWIPLLCGCMFILGGCGQAGPVAAPASPVGMEATAAAGEGESGARVAWVPDAPAAAIGELLSLQLRVSGIQALYGFELQLSYDPAMLEVVDVDAGTEGSQIAHGMFLSPDFVVENRADAAAGTIHYAVTQSAPAEAQSGEGTLVVVELRARAAGTTTLVIRELLLSDVDGAALEVDWEDLALTIQ